MGRQRYPRGKVVDLCQQLIALRRAALRRVAVADLVQPVQYQNAKDFTAWFKQAYDDYGKLVNELGLVKK